MRRTKNIQQPSNVHIAVENFGPIEKAEIDLRPLTVFVGESNTGKTYLSALIYILHRAFEGFSRFPWVYRDLSYLNYTYRLRRSRDQDELDEEILEVIEKLNTHNQPLKFSDIPQKMRSQLEKNLKNSGVFEEELKRCFDLESTSDLVRFTGNKSNELMVSLKVGKENQNFWHFDLRGSISKSGINVNGSINGDLVIQSRRRKTSEDILGIEDLFRILHQTIPPRERGNSYYLPAARSGIMQSHGVIVSSLIDSITSVGLERLREIPAFSGMIVDFLKHIVNYKAHGRLSNEIANIATLLENDVLRGEIEAIRSKASEYPEFRYHPQNVNQALRMSHSSSMVSELTPLVLFLRGVVHQGDTLIIEEPESHLHPAAQTKVAVALARLVRAGVRVIITTHSEWILEQIGNLVREGEVMKLGKNKTELTTWLTKEEVGAWWFRTDTPVKEITFEHIAGIEPVEYGEVAEELYNRSVNLRSQLEDIIGGPEGEHE